MSRPPVVRTVLPNGLTVLVRSDRAAPVVAIVTRVNAGYFDEEDDEVGISHVLEHMYFKGTPTRGVGEIARETRANGGYLNAHTIYDHTSYEVVLPAAAFAQGLEIQADAWANSLLDGGELARELEVIIQEAGRKLDSPPAVAVESMYALLHDRHRLRRWRIGTEAGLRALTRTRLQRFFRNFYRPGNTILTIVGDVDTDAALREVQRRYGGLADARVERSTGEAERDPPGFRFREMDGDIEQAQVVTGWRTPGALHADTPALDLAASILGEGRGSRLYRALRERHLATQASAMNYTPRDVGVFAIRSEGDAGRAAEAAAAAWAVVKSLRDQSPAPHEVLRAQRLFETRWLRRQETMEGQADLLSEWEGMGGWERMEEYFGVMMSLTPAAVRDAVARYLDPDQASVLVYRPRATPVFPGSAAEARSRLDAGSAEPPDDQPVPPVGSAPAYPRVERERVVAGVSVYRTPEGLPILVKRRPGAPLVHLGVFTAEGGAAEPDPLAGIATVMARASVKGSATRDAAAIANQSELLGSSIGAGASAEGVSWTLSVPAPRYRDAVALLQDVVERPAFPAGAIETERAIALSQLAQLRDDMFRYPIRLASAAAFGAHPYGRALLGTDASLAALTPDLVRDWHARHVLSSGGVLAAVGDLDEEELARTLAGGFRGLRAMETPALPPPAWPAGVVVNAESRAKAQTALVIAFPGPARPDPARHAVELLCGVASGLGGRFFEELRDRRSLAYTVHAMSVQRASAGMFLAYIATSPSREAEARDTLLQECDRLRTALVTPEELERAKRFAVGSWRIARQAGAAVLGDLVDAWLFGEGLGELDAFESDLQAVSAEAIRDYAALAFDPGRRVEGIVRGTPA